jgi:DnaJ homolog subfamily C member 2
MASLPKAFVPTQFPRMLCAPSACKDYKGPVVVRSPAAFGTKTIEQAGSAHLQRQLALARPAGSAAANAAKAKAAAKAAAAAAAAAEEEDSLDAPSAAEKKRMLGYMEAGAHYDLLGLGALNINANDDQIKKAYRRLVLRYHPDKAGGSTPSTPTSPSPKAAKTPKGGDGAASADDKTDPLFLAIQKAYDVLSDESRRRAYDSQFEFDDSIPSANTDPADFFATFGPVFDRNGRFSVRKNVPKLGGPDDDDARVTAFYKFWFEFESWRDFSTLGEHDTSQAEYREEKRWMERQNKSVVAKAKKAEVTRVAELVTRAYAKDPRVKDMKEREEEEKRKARDAKMSEKRAAEEAKRKADEEEAQRKAAEEAAKKNDAASAKAAREAEKKAIKRARNGLKKALVVAEDKARAAELTEDDIEFLATRMTSEALLALCVTVCGAAVAYPVPGGGETPLPDAAALDFGALMDAVELEKLKEQAEKEQEKARKAAGAGSVIQIGKKEEVEWTPQELSALAKAATKFPGGTRNRWVTVANVVNQLGQAVPRTPEECIAKAHKIDEERKKISAQAFQVSQASRRNQDGGDLKEWMAEGEPSAAPTPTLAAAPEPAATAGADAPGADGEDGEAGVWTAAEQTALELALKKFPASLEKNERWKLIAEAIPGKTKKQCVARFKEVREKLLAAKVTTAA